MNGENSGTYEYLLGRYGPLLTLRHLAEVMHSTPNGVRMAIERKRQPYAAGLANARRRFGRRVYFEASRVAECIDGRLREAGQPETAEQAEENGFDLPSHS